MNQIDIEKIIERSLSQALAREDNLFQLIKNRIKFFLFTHFKRVKYNQYSLFNFSVLINIPDFFVHRNFEIKGIISEEFYYRNKLAVAVSKESSDLSINEYTLSKYDQAVSNEWILQTDKEFDLKLNYQHNLLVFQYSLNDNYYKFIFVVKNKDDYYVITIISKLKYFIQKESYINRIISTFAIEESNNNHILQ